MNSLLFKKRFSEFMKKIKSQTIYEKYIISNGLK